MADDTPSGSPIHRPLPSIGIPILRDELARSRRQRQGVLAIGAVGCVVLVAAAVVVGSGRDDDEDAVETSHGAVPTDLGYVAPVDAGPELVDAGPPPAPIEIAEASDGTVRTVHLFGSARGFGTALTAAGLSANEASQVVTALDGVLDFRRCRPDDELTVERDPSGALVRFEYRQSLTQVWEATYDETGALHGRAVEVPIVHTRTARGGVVTSSLGAALEGVGLGRTLVGVFLDVFEGRIDFDRDTRAGDAFRVVVDEESVAGTSLGWGTVHAVEYHSARRGVLAAYWFAPRHDLEEFYDETGRALHGGWLRTPLRFDHISSPFDPRRMHPVLHVIRPHNGIDFAAGSGTPVWAAADGEVTFVGPRGPNGNLVSIRHEDGFETFYAHLSRFATGLSTGDTVEQRQVIGYVGSTGRSTGPHLHFGLKRRGNWIDPASELNGPGRMLPVAFQARFREELDRLRGELAAIDLPTVGGTTATSDEPPPPEAPEEGAMD